MRKEPDFLVGALIGMIIMVAILSTVQIVVADRIAEGLVKEAQEYVNGAVNEATQFRDSIECTMQTLKDGCKRWEPRIRLNITK